MWRMARSLKRAKKTSGHSKNLMRSSQMECRRIDCIFFGSLKRWITCGATMLSSLKKSSARCSVVVTDWITRHDSRSTAAMSRSLSNSILPSGSRSVRQNHVHDSCLCAVYSVPSFRRSVVLTASPNTSRSRSRRPHSCSCLARVISFSFCISGSHSKSSPDVRRSQMVCPRHSGESSLSRPMMFSLIPWPLCVTFTFPFLNEVTSKFSSGSSCDSVSDSSTLSNTESRLPPTDSDLLRRNFLSLLPSSQELK
mmetsp:Transcript_42969/g.101026  ORF Transcript_42969/g.101026 Transcript_42969/m.101026 type:complete len:253 (-) Transcript_42969:2756-3514(-)